MKPHRKIIRYRAGSGVGNPLDACEVSWRARAEEVALHRFFAGVTPRVEWFPRSKIIGFGDLAVQTIMLFNSSVNAKNWI